MATCRSKAGSRNSLGLRLRFMKSVSRSAWLGVRARIRVRVRVRG